ncbi:effector candidate partial [Lentinula edodes]|uniref:Effector candidate partial n=1 Tax=Lentinula edodes TaxID=5353 RepID=A0A1Q3ETI1_LENED|nr:effector candidate partial [Lentinula edodes]
MQDSKPVKTPLNPNVTLSKEDSPQTPEDKEAMINVPYMSAVGSLLFLSMIIRADTAYATGVLTRFNSNPGPAHWLAVKHLLRYLKGTIDYELELGPDPTAPDLITAISDSDLGGNKDNGKSTTGLMSAGVVNSTEAEFVASNAVGKEVLAIRSLLTELGYKVASPTIIHVDNQSSIQVAKNPEHHGRMKHLDRTFYWLREQVIHGKLAPSYLPTEDNPADLLTKALAIPKVDKFRTMIGLVKPITSDDE